MKQNIFRFIMLPIIASLALGGSCPDTVYRPFNLEGYVLASNESPISDVRIYQAAINTIGLPFDSADTESSTITDTAGKYFFVDYVFASYSPATDIYLRFGSVGLYYTHPDYRSLFVGVVSDSTLIATFPSGELIADTVLVLPEPDGSTGLIEMPEIFMNKREGEK